MFQKLRPYLAILGFVLLVFMIWYFWNIVLYVIIAAVLSIMGRPLVKRLNRIKIGRFYLPPPLSALFTILLMLALVVGFISFFVPLITSQARVISSINVQDMMHHFSGTIGAIEQFLLDINIIKPGETIEESIKMQLESLISITTFSSLFTGLLSATGSLLMGIFSVLFITFFFLKDEHMLLNMVVLLSPRGYEENVKHVVKKTRSLLSRYFIGLLGELLTMMTLLTIGLTIIGVKNALLIGFLGGLLNVIPYLGPLIGGALAVLFSITTALSMELYDSIFWQSVGIVVVWLSANAIDNFLYQPFIYSNVVRARPLEIFLVIIMAATIAGIPGMILAIPSYTVLRIVLKEFMSQHKLVQKLTERI